MSQAPTWPPCPGPTRSRPRPSRPSRGPSRPRRRWPARVATRCACRSSSCRAASRASRPAGWAPITSHRARPATRSSSRTAGSTPATPTCTPGATPIRMTASRRPTSGPSGVQSLPGVAGGLPDSDRLLGFAVNTYGRWTDAANNEIDLSVDVDRDGTPDFLVIAADSGLILTGAVNGQTLAFVVDLNVRRPRRYLDGERARSTGRPSSSTPRPATSGWPTAPGRSTTPSTPSHWRASARIRRAAWPASIRSIPRSRRATSSPSPRATTSACRCRSASPTTRTRRRSAGWWSRWTTITAARRPTSSAWPPPTTATATATATPSAADS